MLNVNFIAVIVSTIINMVIGALWYSPKMFGETWMKLIGVKPEDMQAMKKEAPKAYGKMFVASFVSAYVLDAFIRYVNARSIIDGAFIGFFVWLGFIATTSLASVLFENRSKNLYLLNNGYYLVSYVIMGGLMALFR